MKEVLVLERVDGTGTDPSCHWVSKPVNRVTEKDIFTIETEEGEKPRITVATANAALVYSRWEIACYEVELTTVETKRLAEGLVAQRLEHYLQQILYRAFRKLGGGLCLRIFSHDGGE